MCVCFLFFPVNDHFVLSSSLLFFGDMRYEVQSEMRRERRKKKKKKKEAQFSQTAFLIRT